MIEAVLVFALLTAVFEWFVLAKLPLRTRLRVLDFPGLISAFFFMANLLIHWGTMTGSMTAVTAALASFGVSSLSRRCWGYITRASDGRLWYVPGWRRFSPEDLK